ncbi:MAG: class I SAM-dependent methyltransferase [Oligoflexia bacterium]|nr:class I SAM-dependent methyltransferase [Oligoflexia bacterium]
MKEKNIYEITDKLVHDACVKLQTPYFGTHLYARQGDSRRHIYMQAVVDLQGKLAGDRPLKILEIGSWAGGSAITWGASLKAYHKARGTVVCIDPWRPYFDPGKIGESPIYEVMAHAAQSGEIYELFLHNIKTTQVDDIVMPFRGESDKVLPLLADNTFDIVFVDGAHTYDAVSKDLKNCARLVSEGGILCGDDLELQLGMADQAHNRENCNKDFIEDPKTKAWYHPGVARAVGEFFGQTSVSVWEGFWAMRRVGDSWKPVELPPVEKYPVPMHLMDALCKVTQLMIDTMKFRGLVSDK